MDTRRRLAVLAPAGLLAITAVGMFTAPSLASEPTIVVNRIDDRSDSNHGEGRCDVSPAAGRQCTLRAAIQTANATAGQDTIGFLFAGTSPVTIGVSRALPTIRQPLVIDGYSAANTSVNTATIGTNARLRIVLKGPGEGSVRGLTVRAKSEISGLVIQHFEAGIFIGPGGGGSRIWGNFIGTAANGRSAAGDQDDGIHVDCLAAVRIGGTEPSQRNLISGNHSGIVLCKTTQGTVIQGNLLGVAADASSGVGNEAAAVLALGTRDVIIGGDGAGANVIAYNGVGIALIKDLGAQPRGVQILRNSIFANQGLGIDLGWDDVTTNDGPGDPDLGANHLQNYPQISSVATEGGRTTIRGTLVSTRWRSYTLRFFANQPGEAEGRTFLMDTTVTTDGQGRADFDLLASVVVVVGKTVTATATDNVREETSEFSAARTVTRFASNVAFLDGSSPALASGARSWIWWRAD